MDALNSTITLFIDVCPEGFVHKDGEGPEKSIAGISAGTIEECGRKCTYNQNCSSFMYNNMEQGSDRCRLYKDVDPTGIRGNGTFCAKTGNIIFYFSYILAICYAGLF